MGLTFKHSLKTTALPQQLWQVWVDVEHWHQWDSEIIAAQLNGPFILGTTGQLTPKTGPRSKFTISQIQPGQSYTFTTQLPLCQLHVHRFWVQHEEQTQFIHEISFTGPLSFIFSRLLGHRFQAVLPEVMEALRQQLETHSS